MSALCEQMYVDEYDSESDYYDEDDEMMYDIIELEEDDEYINYRTSLNPFVSLFVDTELLIDEFDDDDDDEFDDDDDDDLSVYSYCMNVEELEDEQEYEVPRK